MFVLFIHFLFFINTYYFVLLHFIYVYVFIFYMCVYRNNGGRDEYRAMKRAARDGRNTRWSDKTDSRATANRFHARFPSRRGNYRLLITHLYII